MNLSFLFFVPIVLADPGLAVDDKQRKDDNQRSKYTKFWINISPKTLIYKPVFFSNSLSDNFDIHRVINLMKLQ